ncbi:MAG: hypothetical protein EA426_06730 [Spirochaetaceae bacterium]|nr:MAG: hypothetical protein EA426_06730 [Spirochaetaceae bacterium]
MPYEEAVVILARLGVGAVATFLAILLWARTRDTAWVFVILGTIVAYGEAVLTTLEAFGIVRIAPISIAGIPVFEVLLTVFPTAFIAVGFLIVILRRRSR